MSRTGDGRAGNVAQFDELVAGIVELPLAGTAGGWNMISFMTRGPTRDPGLAKVRGDLGDELFITGAGHIASERDAFFGSAKGEAVDVTGQVGGCIGPLDK